MTTPTTELHLLERSYIAVHRNTGIGGSAIDIFDHNDLAQEVAMRFLKTKGSTIARSEQDDAFMGKIARNRWIDVLRRARIRSTSPLCEREGDNLCIKPEEIADSRMSQLKSRLSSREAQILDCWGATGCDKTEAAHRLGITEGHLDNVITRIRRKASLIKMRTHESRTIISAYRERLAASTLNPASDFMSIDVTGNAGAFFNWVEDPYFERVLIACGKYSRARRALRHGAIGARRNFIVDERLLTSEYIANFRETIRQHVSHDVQVGIVFSTNRLPSELRVDVASFGNCCVDFGHLELQPDSDQGNRHVFLEKHEHGWNSIGDKIAWCSDKSSIDVLLSHECDIPDVIQELRRRARRSCPNTVVTGCGSI